MKRIIMAAFAALILAGSSGTAQAETTGEQRFMISIHGPFVPGNPTYGVVMAKGPIEGKGTSFTYGLVVEPDGSLSGVELLTFDDGTVALNISGTREFSFNPTACRARFETVGTWWLSDGTDSFQGVTGTGTFTTSGTIVGDKGPDGCSLAGEGVRYDVIDHAQGTVTIP